MTATTINEAAVKRYEDAYKRSRSMKEIGNFMMAIAIIIAFFFAFTGLADSHGGPPAFIILLFSGFIGLIGFSVGLMVRVLGQIMHATLDSAVHTSPFLSDQDRAAAMSLVPSPEQQRTWATIGLDPGVAVSAPPPAPHPSSASVSPLAVLFAERETLIPADRLEPEGRRRGSRSVRRRWN